MKTIGTLIWMIFGGILIAIEYVISSVIMMITIIGIPFGLQSFKLAQVALFPFQCKVEPSEHSIGCISSVMNILWIICGGIWITLTHLAFGLLLCITIIGIPFGMQHFKLMSLAFCPFGKRVTCS